MEQLTMFALAPVPVPVRDAPLKERRAKPARDDTTRGLLWRDGLATLERITGLPNAKARRLLGRLSDAAAHDHVGLLALIEQAADARLDKPISWIVAGCARLSARAAADDPWGLRAWWNALPVDAATPFHARSWSIEAVTDILDATGFAPNWRGGLDWLRAILADGYHPDSIARVVRDVRARFDGEITSLRFFDRSVRASAARWDAARCEFRAR